MPLHDSGPCRGGRRGMPPGLPCCHTGGAMKALAPHDRPREKLQRLGASALGDNELLAAVLGHGSRAHSALDLANAILGRIDGLVGLTRITPAALRRVPGVGVARAAQMLAAVELGRRTLMARSPARQRLGSPRAVAEYLLPRFGARAVEQCGVVLLDARGVLLDTTVLTVGTVDAAVMHPRDVFREAVITGASAVILFHNHPSGDPEPSPEDVALTERMAAAAVLMGIELADHLILADARYYSFREAGFVRFPGR